MKLNFNPSESDNKDLGLQFKLAVDPSAKGNFKYDSTTPLVTELASDGQSTAGTSTVTVNGTTYDVVKSSNAINVSYYINDAQLPSFTGDVAFGNLNSSNQFVSGSSINYTSTSTNLPTLSVRLSTNGTSTVKNPQFIVMIPKGFTSSTSDFGLIPANSGNYFNGVFNGSNKSKDYSIQDLGKIGPNGEQLFKITLNFNPSWSSASNFGGQFKLTLDPTQKGYYTYDSKTAPIVSELASDATSSVSGDNKTYTFDANGQNIKVVNSSYASSNSINYGIDTNELPTFTGTANLLDANGNPIADNTVYSGTQVPQYTFRLSTAGNSTVQNPKFIVMIPAGFTATTDSFKFTYGSYDGTAKVEEVDGKGPNGEQLFEVTLSGATPNFTTAQVTGSITLTPNFTGENGGSHTYSNSTAPLISELSTDGQAGGGTYTFTTNAGPINVVQSNQTVNWLNAGTTGPNAGVSATYIIQVGKEKLATDAYSISNIKATPHEGKTSNDAGYEQLSFTFTPKGELKDGQYFDVHLGLPNQNGIELYDKTLGDNLPIYAKDGTQVATAYKMGTYYRVVFNSNAETVTTGNNHPSWTLNLKWGNAQSQQLSLIHISEPTRL